MKTSDLRIKILQTVQKADCYGYEIHKKLAAQGIEVDIGRLYKVLTEMLTEGLVGCRWEKSGKGPEKRVYRLAEKGVKELDRLLRDAIDIIHEHYSEYLLSLPAATSVFDALARIAVPEPVEHSKIAFFAKNPSPVHQRIFASLLERIPKSEVFAVQPIGVNLNLNIKHMVSLHGDYDSIPVRDKHITLLIVEGLPHEQDLVKAAEEWHRVIQENGRLVLITPTAVFSPYKDPLSIGDFIEKIEHASGSDEIGRGETLVQILERFFQKVKKRQMLQMTLLLAFEPCTNNVKM